MLLSKVSPPAAHHASVELNKGLVFFPTLDRLVAIKGTATCIFRLQAHRSISESKFAGESCVCRSTDQEVLYRGVSGIGFPDECVPGNETTYENTWKLLTGMKMPRKLADAVPHRAEAF